MSDEIKKGVLLTAINVCKMKGSGTETLTIGRKYEVLGVDYYIGHFYIKDDFEDIHHFGISCYTDYFESLIKFNNGWIKIETEDDLPKENIDCFYIPKNSNEVVVGCFRLKSYKGWKNMFTVDDNIAVGFGYVTHYQIIEKPKPPIF